MTDRPRTGVRLTRDLVLFGATVALAWVQRWSAGDLLWSLWLASLLLGYSLLLTSVLLRPWLALLRREHKTGVAVSVVAVTVGSLFMVAFFTVHFGGFHFVHSMFLNDFFPLVETDGVGEFGMFFEFIRVGIARYWPFVVLSAVAMDAPFRRALRGSSGKATMLPYLNVIRMHVMIFLIAGLHSAGVPDLALYPALLLYFFPYRDVRDALKRRSGSSVDSPNDNRDPK